MIYIIFKKYFRIKFKDNDQIVEPILKYVLVSFNLLTFIVAIGFIVGGSWLLYQSDVAITNSANFQSIFDLATDLGGFCVTVGVLGFNLNLKFKYLQIK